MFIRRMKVAGSGYRCRRRSTGERKYKEDLIKAMWEGESIPQQWKGGLNTPIYKKGDKRVVGNYKGVNYRGAGLGRGWKGKY